MADTNPTTPSVPLVRFNDPSHPAPITQQRPAKRPKMHRQHVKARAPFLPQDHIPVKHGLKPVLD